MPLTGHETCRTQGPGSDTHLVSFLVIPVQYIWGPARSLKALAGAQTNFTHHLSWGVDAPAAAGDPAPAAPLPPAAPAGAPPSPPPASEKMTLAASGPCPARARSFECCRAARVRPAPTFVPPLARLGLRGDRRRGGALRRVRRGEDAAEGGQRARRRVQREERRCPARVRSASAAVSPKGAQPHRAGQP
eukprot:gene19363-biopygen17497